MAEYKKNTGFKKSFASRGASGPGRFSRPNSDGPREMFKAQCSNCKNECDVPFKPNGTKPVFCQNCFKRDEDRDSRDSRGPRDSFQKRDFNAPRSFAPASQSNDHRIDDLKRQMMTLDSKLDRVVQMLESSSRKAAATAPEAIVAEATTEEKPAKTKAVKKVAAKKAK
jgi:CxxC-x17-CxxC domain-containing protein